MCKDENIIKLRRLLEPILMSDVDDEEFDEEFDFESYDTPCGY